MPRPKVKPHERRRSAQACQSCKQSKIRCDGQSPCLSCVRRGRRESCAYAPSARGNATFAINLYARQDQNLHHSQTPLSPLSPVHEVEQPNVEVGAQDDGSPTQYDSPHETWTTPSRTTQSSMLISSRGEKLYIGPISSLALLQLLRNVVRQRVGLCSFSNKDMTGAMLDITLDHQDEGHISWSSDCENLQHKRALIQTYFEASSGLINLYTKDEAEGLLQHFTAQSSSQVNTPTSSTDRTDLAAICLIIAIGGQCRGVGALDQSVANAHFHRARKIAFEGLLCDPSTDLVRIFLLMALYQLGACQGSSACMYLGVAARAASILGLHRTEQYSVCDRPEAMARLRAWRSLRILDTLVCSILGRATSANIYPTIDELHEVPTERHNMVILDSMYRACLNIDAIQQELSQTRSPSDSMAEELLAKLRDWSEDLPDELRGFAVDARHPATINQDREHVIGATHVSCSYYYSVILITRPYLISHLMTRLQNRERSNDRALLMRSSAGVAQTAKFAEACIDSAVYMTQLCADAVESGLLHDNMCMLKAWMFVVGLLLGFHLFVEDKHEATAAAVRTAFDNACVVLRQFSRLSSRANYYLEILVSLSDAIAAHRQQLAASKPRSADGYVQRIFTISKPAAAPHSQAFGYTSPMSGVGSLESNSEADSYLAAFGQVTAEENTAGLASFWDEVAFGNQLFNNFF